MEGQLQRYKSFQRSSEQLVT